MNNLGYGTSGTKHLYISQTQPPIGAKPEGKHKYRSSALRAGRR
uniref:Uncharacterized protein n=1 Tax=Tetraselmis sp. GSL018 TaxID=582737 RepID=A0A061S9N6_9CHLO